MGLEGTTADGNVEMSGDEATPAGTDLESGTDVYSMPVGGGTPHASIEEDHPIGGIWVDDIGIIWTTPQPPAVWQIAH
jgi:hypothetical protein